MKDSSGSEKSQVGTKRGPGNDKMLQKSYRKDDGRTASRAAHSEESDTGVGE